MGVPLGHRYRVSSGSDIIPVERITKTEVDGILAHDDFECFCCKDRDKAFQKYEGCINNLYSILHQGTTKVKVAGSRTPGYRDGYRTVVMTAPCVAATFLIRTSD